MLALYVYLGFCYFLTAFTYGLALFLSWIYCPRGYWRKPALIYIQHCLPWWFFSPIWVPIWLPRSIPWLVIMVPIGFWWLMAIIVVKFRSFRRLKLA
ncbi:hypothetical protein ES705_28095 [subsurface metagenome]